MRRVVRSNNRIPSADSSFSIRRLIAGCDRCSAVAAARKLFISATATKARKSAKSKFMLIAHQKKKIEQYTNQYLRRKIFSWQGVAALAKAT
jgi:hypothetical protein